MEKKIYSCDKCEKVVNDFNELRSIVVGFGVKRPITTLGAVYVRPTQFIQHKEIDLCVDCLRKIGIVAETIEDDKPVEKVISIEDRLYDIVQELVDDAMDNH